MYKQVDKEHYGFKKYFHLQRWNSFWYQLYILNNKEFSTLLEIGGAGRMLVNILPMFKNITMTRCDIADDLNPDVIADVRQLPFKNGEFDASCAFQVLEHIPLEDFEKAISEMARVSKKYVFISLPHYGPNIKIDLKIPLLPRIKFHFKIPFPIQHRWDGQHYYEIGKKGAPLSLIKAKIGKYLKIEDDFIPFENNYHHFFVCSKYDKEV